MTNETHVKNWCHRAGVQCWDLPGLLRAFWKTNLVTKGEVGPDNRLFNLFKRRNGNGSSPADL